VTSSPWHFYSGLVELIVNAVVDVTPGFIDWERS